MTASELEGALRARGLACRVEARERLAILIPDEPLMDVPIWRVEAVRIARETGFTHIALELPSDRCDSSSR